MKLNGEIDHEIQWWLKTMGALKHGELAQKLPKFSRAQIGRRLVALVDAGKLQTTGGAMSKRYEIRQQEEKVLGPVKPFNPLNRDIFENWKLCERDPFEALDVPRLIR